MSPDFDCKIERHKDGLHFIMESESDAILALPDPPGYWFRRGNVLIFCLGLASEKSDKKALLKKEKSPRYFCL